MRNSCKYDRPIYTMDIETDPFEHGRLPQPFAVGLYGENIGFQSFWKKRYARMDVIKESVNYLREIEPGFVFIHNGGKFDLFYYLKHLGEKMFILNNRIVVSSIGEHEVRDSFSIMPFALKRYKKDEIDYSKFEADKRDSHKKEILSYLKGDCVYLHELCSKFVERFGAKITIGSTSLGLLKQQYKYETLSTREDAEIRSKYYYGGRVQCFEKGIIDTDVKVYDVNSMYPYVMQNFAHPIGKPISIGKKITGKTFFISVTGVNYGAFPQRSKQGTTFTGEYGTYHVTKYEWETAINLSLFRPHKIEQTIDFDNITTFEKFVTGFYNEREQAKVSGDTITDLFCKFVLNSAYGKFAQNPANCFDYKISKAAETLPAPWVPVWIAENEYVIWRKVSDMGERLRVNCATAASITGAARAVLLAAIASAQRPLYCDTDSIICERIGDVPIDKTKLGAWKLEKRGNRVAIAGRKLYAVFQDCDCVKLASKGVKLTAQEIEAVALGKVIVYKRPVPSFKWDGSHGFITRRVRLT